ncbi:MAG: OmpH family outer membrane protein [Flavobacteriales bacterium]|nr:OmpH family outer membrane protein [Flavobacteriales bacterium]
MNKNLGLLLIVWNVVLSALLAWTLWGRNTSTSTNGTAEVAPEASDSTPVATLDTAALVNAKIAFFFMDSVQERYELVKERGNAFRSEGKRLQDGLQQEMAKSQARYEALMNKDHTYSTKAEVQADEQEVQALMGRIQGMQARGEEQMAEMEVRMLEEISKEIMDYLTEYNRTGKHDFIFSVQSGGQIWVGNPALDLTPRVIADLNARHRANKTPAAKTP